MMKIFKSPLLILSCLCFLNGNAQDDDADLPSFLKTPVDKEAYLQRRDAFLQSRQISLRPLSYNPRVAAIEAMRQMETAQRSAATTRTLTPSWVQLGPSPIPNGQTTGTLTSVSGRVTAIVVHPTNSSILYIGTANGGVYRSMNGGSSWTAIFDGAQSLAIGALALAPSNPSILYVGTGEPQQSSDSYAGVGLYRIDNADASPTLVGPINPLRNYNNASSNPVSANVFAFRSISKIVVHPTDPATVFVATTNGQSSNPGTFSGTGTVPPSGIRGVYRSTNATSSAASVSFSKLTVVAGNCFDSPCTGNFSVMDMVMDPVDPNTLLCWVSDGVNSPATNLGGVYKSTNALAATPTFTRKFSALVANGRGELAIASVGGVSTVYVAHAGSANGAIHVSTDGGETYAPVGGTFTFCSGQCFYDIAVATHPANPQKLYVGGSSGSNIFRYSTNGGTTFTVANNLLHGDVHALAIDPSNTNNLYLGCDGGIFKSTNAGVSWTSLNTNGLHATQFQSIALHPTDLKFTIGGTQDNGTELMKPDGTFTRVDFGDGGYALIDQNATNTTNVTMYHTYFNQANNLVGFARSDIGVNAFENWTLYGCGGTTNGISCTPTSVLFYAPIALGPGNPNTVYYGSDILYRSADKGVTATAASQAMGTSISSISVAAQDDNYRVIGLSTGRVFATIAGSATLVDITPTGAPSVAVSRVAISPVNKNVVYVTYVGYFGNSNPHVFKSSNLGNLGGTGVTWTATSSGLPDIPVNCITISAANPNNVFVGTDVGVFSSVDAGATWSSYSANLPSVPVFDMAIHPVSNVLRIATHGRGMWEASASPLPVSFTSFDASVFGRTHVLLQWFTATEINNRGFEVQRAAVASGSLQRWETIGFVKGSGSVSSPRRYEFEDVPVGGRRFIYRLRQLDYDNNAKFSEQRQVALADFDFALFPVYPNPAKSSTVVKYQVPEASVTSLRLYNASGALVREVFNESKEAGVYQETVNTANLSAGVYYLTLRSGIYYNSKSFVVE